jgi:hypothetical protein
MVSHVTDVQNGSNVLAPDNGKGFGNGGMIIRRENLMCLELNLHQCQFIEKGLGMY